MCWGWEPWPKGFTYVGTGEGDAGFRNVTQAVAAPHQIGGYREMDEKLYKPVSIACIRMENAPSSDAARKFAEFLGTDDAKAIIAAHGL
ncbi:hypothetical protein DSECCO2_480180 [anaerobic digester metagenome]